MAKRKGAAKEAAAAPGASSQGPKGLLALHRSRFVEWSPSAVVAIAGNDDGSSVAVARENGAIELWDTAHWHCYMTIPGHQEAAVTSVAWVGGSEGRAGRLFTAGLDGQVAEWNLVTGKPKYTTDSYGGAVWSMAPEPVAASDARGDDARWFAMACDDGCVRIFGLDSTLEDDRLEYVRTCPKVQGRMLSVAWSPDGKVMATGSSDGCVRLWETASASELLRITVGDGSGKEVCVWSVLVLPDGTVVSGDTSGNTQFWDGQFGTLLHNFQKHSADVLAIAASLDGASVFSAGIDNQVKPQALSPKS